MRRRTATVVRGICISEKMPSCMRAPPEAANRMKGVRCSAAWVRPVITASPAAMPSEPPMKSKSCTATVAAMPPIEPAPTITASFSPVLRRASRSLST